MNTKEFVTFSKNIFSALLLIVLLGGLLVTHSVSEAATVDELKQQIDDRADRIAELEKEIQKYKKEIHLAHLLLSMEQP